MTQKFSPGISPEVSPGASPGGSRRVSLVLGGARSGKSRFAETLCRAAGGTRLYIATAEARDAEMQARVAQHRADRAKDGWHTLEEPMDLAGAITREAGTREAGQGRVLLVDCLTLWLSNHLLADSSLEEEIDRLADAVAAQKGRLVLVANEVGYGIVPENRLARTFRDHAGRLNQRIAGIADDVTLVVAGLPVTVKATPGSGPVPGETIRETIGAADGQ